MSYQTENISANQKELKTDKMKVSAVFMTGQKVRDEILQQVEKVSGNENISELVVVLSDAHLKSNVLAPEGSIVVSNNSILPQMLDTALNCGMRIIKTDLRDEDLTPEKMQELFLNLQKEIPTRKYLGKPIPLELAKEVLSDGSGALEKYYNFRIKNEIKNTYAQGNFFSNPLLQKYALKAEEVSQIIPEIFMKMSRYRYGILGATDSHSIMLSRIDSVLDQENGEKLGIKEGQYVLTMHTGSGIIGRYIAYLYSPQKKRLAHKIPVEIGKFFGNRKAKENYQKIQKALDDFSVNPNVFGFSCDSEEGKMCLQGYLMAGNVGFANRAVITHKIDLALEECFKRKINLELIYDAPHVFLDKENQKGKEMFIHRNGAVRAQKDEPVYVAPFANTFGYLGMGIGGNNSAFQSANHKLGKLEDVDLEFMQNLSGEQKNLKEVLIFDRKGKRKVFAEKQHSLYAEEIAREMEKNNLFKMVARVKPVAVLTY